MNSYGEYIGDASEKNVKLQSFYSEEIVEKVNKFGSTFQNC